MLGPDVIEAIARVIQEAEERLLSPIRDRRVGQEPDMTSRLVHGIEIGSQSIDGIVVEFTVVDGIGPGAPERDTVQMSSE